MTSTTSESGAARGPAPPFRPLWEMRTTSMTERVASSAGGHPITLGVDTFGDVTNDDQGRPLSHGETIRNLVAEGVLADEVGLDHFAIGEHHVDWMPLSAGDVVLGAIASRTSRIRLGSGVTVISSD